MSGGYFDYAQYRIHDIVVGIEEAVAKRNEYGLDDTDVVVFQHAVELLTAAQVYVQRIDWYLSGDDGRETFRRRLIEDLAKIGSTNQWLIDQHMEWDRSTLGDT